MIDDEALAMRRANYAALTPVSLLERTASVYPERTAVRYQGRSTSYAAFARRCRQLGSALRRAGIRRGDVVSILAPNTPAHLEAHFGVAMAGAVLHSINTRLDAATVAFMLRHCGSSMLLFDGEYAPLVRAMRDDLGQDLTVIRIADDQAPPATDFAEDYEGLIARGDPAEEPLRPESEWDAISLNYTSGTTGDPKGVVYHYRGAYLNAVGNILAWGLHGHPTYLWTLPMFHCNGWCFPWTITALAGTHVCLRRIDGESIARAFIDEQVTHFCGAPIVLSRALEAPADLRPSIPRGIRMMVAGAPPAAAVIRAAEEVGIDVTQTYGLTEVYGPCVVSEWQAEWDGLGLEERAALKARQGVRYHLQEDLAVLDPVTMAPVETNGAEMGEVMIRGNITMKGYLGDAAATARAFEHGWFHTGDLAVRHPDNYIEIRDRSKDIIISGGENISTIEIEGVLLEHPDIAEAAVVAKPDPTWGEVPCAFVRLHEGATADAGQIRDFCAARLARFKIPKAIVFSEIPKTATGKAQKFHLRAIAASQG